MLIKYISISGFNDYAITIYSQLYIHIWWPFKLAGVEMCTAHPVVLIEALGAYPIQASIPQVLHPSGRSSKCGT